MREDLPAAIGADPVLLDGMRCRRQDRDAGTHLPSVWQSFHRAVGNTAGRGQFCSRACAMAARGVVEIEKTCVWCNRDYIARGGKSQFCSDICRGQAMNLKRGRFRVLTAPAFDYVMRMAA